MNRLLDPSSDYAENSEVSLQTTVNDFWHGLGVREESDADSEADRDSVLLECSGDLVDAGSVRVIRVRRFAAGVQTLDFVCPQCRQRHESLRFR